MGRLALWCVVVGILCALCCASPAAKRTSVNSRMTLLVQQQDLQPSSTPPPGCANLTCVHGACKFDASSNTTYCECEHGYRGPSCSLAFFFAKTMYGKKNENDTTGMRYMLPGEEETIHGKTILDITQNLCLLKCEEELEFICAAVVFFPSQAGTSSRCVYVDHRFVTPTTDVCVSYTRGPEECYFGDGLSFRGTLNTTASGHTCQAWASQSPNSHSRTLENYPLAGLEANYCRNPDGEDKPWCYTIEGDRWEYCDLPTCVPNTPTPTPTPVPNCPIGCQLHGVCEHTSTGEPSGTCKCFVGWVAGPSGNCSVEASCPNNCSGHGSCYMGNCKCDPLWDSGPGDCSEQSKSCPSGCSGHGRCDGATGNCVCFFGWAGSACENEFFVCKNNCSGAGTCVVADGTCDCEADFTGDDCSESVCPDACNNHGVCNPTTRACSCDQGFIGTACDQVEQGKCLNDCSGNGRCVAGKCFCNHGWSLADCSKWVPPSCLNDCSGHGSCNEGICECDKHYSGTDCSSYTAPHYAPWPIAAVVIPMILVAAFIGWLFYVCYQVDMADGESDLLNLPFIRALLSKKQKKFSIVEGETRGSRLKKTTYE